jgi:uncharacterized protein
LSFRQSRSFPRFSETPAALLATPGNREPETTNLGAGGSNPSGRAISYQQNWSIIGALQSRRDHLLSQAERAHIDAMKSREAILQSRWLRPFAHLFAHPTLWHLNRRSVPRALALGFFAAFIVPVGQFLLAALLAIPLRANVPLAAAATLITNPLTFPPIYYGAYRVGSFLLHHVPGEGTGELARDFGQTVLDVSGATALGLVIFAVLGALLGYFAAAAWWRLRLVRRWRGKPGQA